MQTVSSILLGVGFACTLGGIVHILSPGGSTERLLRLLITLFILVSILSPLRENFRDFFTEKTPEIETDFAAEIVLENAKKAVENSAKNVLQKYGFSNAEIEVKMQTKNGEAHTEIFRIIGVDGEKKQEIADEIFALTGERPVFENAAGVVDGG